MILKEAAEVVRKFMPTSIKERLDYSYKPSPSYPGGNGFSFSSGNCLTPTSVFAYFLAVIYCLLI